MHTHYPDATLACAEVAQRLARDHPNAVLRVTYQGAGAPQASVYARHMGDLRKILARLAQRFREAEVFYTDHDPTGMLCMIECPPESDSAVGSEGDPHHRIVVSLQPALPRSSRAPAMPSPRVATHPWRADPHRHRTE